MHQEAARTGELVGLPRQHLNGQGLVGQVRTGEFEALGEFGFVHIDRGRRFVGPLGLEFLEGVLGEFVVGLARGVVIGSHGGELHQFVRLIQYSF